MNAIRVTAAGAIDRSRGRRRRGTIVAGRRSPVAGPRAHLALVDPQHGQRHARAVLVPLLRHAHLHGERADALSLRQLVRSRDPHRLELPRPQQLVPPDASGLRHERARGG
eukprot:1550-Pelagococcus_subviridis.AAC.2